jgi:hypothetical protein
MFENLDQQLETPEQLVDWSRGQASILGLAVEGIEVVRIQPWASAVRLETSGARGHTTLWAKTIAPLNRFEIDVLNVLETLDVPSLVRPLASNRERGFLLLVDGGPTVASLASTGDVTGLDEQSTDVALASWRAMLDRLGRTQRLSASSISRFLDAGCLDLRPRNAVNYFDFLVTNAYVKERFVTDGTTTSELADFGALRPALESVANRLEMSSIAATIQHDDLGPSNVCLDGRVIDWGDASVAHPFASLLSAVGSNTDNRPGALDDREALAREYLSGWLDETQTDQTLGGVIDRDELVNQLAEEARLACVLAPLGRIASWLRAPSAASEMYPGDLARWVRHMIEAA